MAKDRRNKTRDRLDLENETRGKERRTSSTSRSTARTEAKPARDKAAKPRKPKKRKMSRAAVIIYWVLAIAILTLLVFLIVAGFWLFERFNYQVDKQEMISPIERDVTPVDRQDKVAYYLFGLLGENNTDETVMLSVVCHDKQNNTVSVLELPASTYLDKGDGWKVDTLGRVYANPKALDWCDACKKRLYAPEITEGETATHTVCGGPVTAKKGSAIGGIVDFVNDQLSLPIDEYFMLPTQGLEVLVDGLGGIDVELPSAMMLGDINYEPGVQTITGAAAADFILESTGADRTRRQRQVLGAVLARTQKLDAAALNDGAIADLMDSEHPLRTDVTHDDELAYDELSELITTFKNVPLTNVRIWMIPGESAYDGEGDHVYSVHKQELLTLLNEQFNPHGLTIEMTDLTVPELQNTVAADTRHGVLGDGLVAEQVGTILDTGTE